MLSQSFMFFTFTVLVTASDDDEIVKDITKKYADAIGKCQSEINLTEDAIDDFSKYWNRHDLETRGVGCIIMCFVKKIGILGMGAVFRKENVTSFVRQYKAGEIMSDKFSELYGRCFQNAKESADECQQGLMLARCFRYGVFELKSVPHNHEFEKKMTHTDGSVQKGPEYQPRRSLPSQHGGTHPAHLGGGHQRQLDGAYSDHALSGYPGQYDGSFLDQTGTNYLGQAFDGLHYPGQLGPQEEGYLSQQRIIYPGQYKSVPGQPGDGFPGQLGGGYLDPSENSFLPALCSGYQNLRGNCVYQKPASGYLDSLGSNYAGYPMV